MTGGMAVDGIHDMATAFSGAASVYEQTRPGYPPEVRAWLGEHVGIGRGRRVLDLAAGTGKLTRELLSTGASVIAVEPIEGMRRTLAAALGIEEERINLKAKTNEGVDAVGRGEAIAAQAIAVLENS